MRHCTGLHCNSILLSSPISTCNGKAVEVLQSRDSRCLHCKKTWLLSAEA